MDNIFIVTVNKTLLNYCLTIPAKFHAKLNLESLLKHNSEDISIKWGEEVYSGKLHGKHRIRNNKNEICGYKAYQLHFDNELLYRIKETFIQSYILIQSQIYEHDSGKQYRTEIPNEIKEQLKVIIHNSTHFELQVEKKTKTPYDNVFRNLLFEDVFGWMGKSRDDYSKMITASSTWLPISDIKKYSETPYVIYYLVDEVKKQVYIGSAKRLGDRVKPDRMEIPGWNKFRFEKLHDNYYQDIQNVEYHSIVNFSKFLKNKSTLGVSDYVLVNKDYGYFKNK